MIVFAKQRHRQSREDTTGRGWWGGTGRLGQRAPCPVDAESEQAAAASPLSSTERPAQRTPLT